MSGTQEEIQEEGTASQLKSQPTTSQGLDITATTDETAEDTEPVLSDELRKAYNSLNPDSFVHYHNLRDKTAKVTFLKAIISTRKDERKRGYFAIISVLGHEKGISRKSFLNATYSSVPFILSCLITGLIVIYRNSFSWSGSIVY
ncbi:2104_t:CDS:2 [Gigaspora rosea]|nr:2104_t:CDS:2 [Gigaspora rosea]